MIKKKPRTVTIQLDAELARLLDAVTLSYGTVSTATQIARSACEQGLLRLAVAGSHSPVAEVANPLKAAVREMPRARVAGACCEVIF